ncbi:MAG: cell division protein ZapA [Geminicoccaceae bacterium]|nr:cell division protein ZapA [Geminicoccaceae bacterium]MCS7267905.1 cell division protein ZapA [Geminicoccaceae bacterium]MDW8124465.1 cell division protein ZapA [Geminicoccaceae bacterium]MDW8342496.1 cell division protein ZapA [Geminicoccaceae bacterium]
MPTLEITVANRRYLVQCDEGQEGRLKRLAAYVDGKASELARATPQLGEGRLLLLVALLVADELFDAYDEIQQLRGRLAQEARAGEADAAKVLERVAARLDELARAVAQT